MRETMMNVEVSTQIRENYGAHEWDGNGECPQYWKSKGGEDYIISGAPSEEAAYSFVSSYIVDPHNDYFRESVMAATEVPANHRTWMEECTGEVDDSIRIEWDKRFTRFPTIKS